MIEFAKSRPIVIVPYQPSWVDEFTQIGGELRRVLGDTAVRIDHIGSTSVPDLPAKDIIDIQVTVADLGDEAVLQKLWAAGFQSDGQYSRDDFVGFADQQTPQLRKRFFREREGERRTHIHIRENGRFNQRYPLLFRDYLRAEPVMRQGYAVIKQRLSQIFPESIDGYLYIKDPLMDMIFHAAQMWAKSSNWSPDDMCL